MSYEDIENFFLEEKLDNETLEFKSGGDDFDYLLTKNNTEDCLFFKFIWRDFDMDSPREKEIKRGEGKVCRGDLIPLRRKDENLDVSYYDAASAKVWGNYK